MALYKNVIHNSNNTLPKWYLEALGIYVSYLNHCDYCVDHHFAGLKRLWNDQEKSEDFLVAIKKNRLKEFFDKKWVEGLIEKTGVVTVHGSGFGQKPGTRKKACCDEKILLLRPSSL